MAITWKRVGVSRIGSDDVSEYVAVNGPDGFKILVWGKRFASLYDLDGRRHDYKTLAAAKAAATKKAARRNPTKSTRKARVKKHTRAWANAYWQARWAPDNKGKKRHYKKLARKAHTSVGTGSYHGIGRLNPGRSTVDAHAARELELFITSSGWIYKNKAQPEIARLAKKMAKGIYKPQDAQKSWLHLMEPAAKMYCREFCSSESEWREVFSASTRRLVAADLEEHYREEVQHVAKRIVVKPAKKRAARKNPRGVAKWHRTLTRTTAIGIAHSVSKRQMVLELQRDGGVYNIVVESKKVWPAGFRDGALVSIEGPIRYTVTAGTPVMRAERVALLRAAPPRKNPSKSTRRKRRTAAVTKWQAISGRDHGYRKAPKRRVRKAARKAGLSIGTKRRKR